MGGGGKDMVVSLVAHFKVSQDDASKRGVSEGVREVSENGGKEKKKKKKKKKELKISDDCTPTQDPAQQKAPPSKTNTPTHVPPQSKRL